MPSAYTKIPKPTGTGTYTKVNGPGKHTYDDALVTFDDPIVAFDGGDGFDYTKVNKPAGTPWTKISKPTS